MTIALAIIVLIAVAIYTRPRMKRYDMPPVEPRYRDWEQ